MTEGERIVDEVLDLPKGWEETNVYDRPRAVARRIDAALAERDREHQAALAACATTGGQWGQEILDLRAALAEREAMVAALREVMARALESARYVLESGGAIQLDRERVVRDLENGLTSTADAAARCIGRARQEGAEEMRERCAQVANDTPNLWEAGHPYNEPHMVVDRSRHALRIVAAIRALDAGALAARRG